MIMTRRDRFTALNRTTRSVPDATIDSPDADRVLGIIRLR